MAEQHAARLKRLFFASYAGVLDKHAKQACKTSRQNVYAVSVDSADHVVISDILIIMALVAKYTSRDTNILEGLQQFGNALAYVVHA